jgi:hypothetical protein
MGQDKLAKPFQSSGRRQVVAWYPARKLGVLSWMGAVAIATNCLGNEMTVATPSTDWRSDLDHNQPAIAQKERKASSTVAQAFPDTLPPPNFPVPSGGAVNVPPVNPPAPSTRSVPTLSAPPGTLPPTIFPTDQAPAVSVPSLQSLPSQTLPVTTSEPIEAQPESESPTPSSPPVIEFGQPLPKTTSTAPTQNLVPFATIAISSLKQVG